MIEIKCRRCEAVFTLVRTDKRVISCQSCSALIDVAESSTIVPALKARRDGLSVILEPKEDLSNKYRCLKCTKVFLFIPERRGSPYCPHCDSPEVVAVAPVARVVTQDDLPKVDRRRAQLLRFIRSNNKALAVARQYFEGMTSVVKRAALPPEEEERLLKLCESTRDDVLNSIERVKDAELARREKELGIEDGQNIV